MKRPILFLLAATSSNGFAPLAPRHHSRSSAPLLVPSSSSSSQSKQPLYLGDFNEYSQTYEDQDLAYEDTQIGTESDEVAMEGKFVTVGYTGRLMSNNKQFDSGSISFRIGERRVIPGWEQGLVGMKIGGKRTLRIPPQLAYGNRGAGEVIPPNSHLEFDVELKGIANGAVEEKMAELTSLSPVKKAAGVFFAGSLIYDVLHFGMHVI
mmetsp:Transcript_28382/g.59929  ORF Transcript_28382/g.59929 Transcript_28382/m.59929 type:complete len:208 (-) Transcript_28382:202-825(-)|eukprot:CAMPEP_0183749504 /NCGR_PEP_ID=MMETSP0737-20130205/68319_1 /TAXON_ID=385413 /ORGANISM="Thalassiosira miniscula, Strain CCMP1093" /LENGTH=207 /DNA_ID=CAMNT_0025985261 /DNA_START=613 /DNA_END=1236 /DNA_ORIENTATION=-